MQGGERDFRMESFEVSMFNHYGHGIEKRKCSSKNGQSFLHEGWTIELKSMH